VTIAAALSDVGTLIGDTLVALGHEIAELHRPGPRARLCVMAALSVALSITAALALHLDSLWWAAISGFISVQATRPGSIRRGAMRIVGTAAGALVGFCCASWLAYDHVACALFLLACTTLGVLGTMVSPHGYAWLLAGITAVMVVVMSLDDPTVALNVAVYRTMEITLGTAAALCVAFVLGSDDLPQAPTPPGWRDLLGANWPAVQHALRSGVAVALLPFLWNWLEVPSLSKSPSRQRPWWRCRRCRSTMSARFSREGCTGCSAVSSADSLAWRCSHCR
jgi:uncharacterized membrane protein YccC